MIYGITRFFRLVTGCSTEQFIVVSSVLFSCILEIAMNDELYFNCDCLKTRAFNELCINK